MPRKKMNMELPQDVSEVQGFHLMDALEGMADEMVMDASGAMLAAMEFEKALLEIAHTAASQAVRIPEGEQEAERIKAAERQVKLTGRLFRQLEADIQGPRR